MSKSGVRFSLKKKLLLVSMAVLIIPYMGFDYLRQMETYLRNSLQSSLIDSAYAVAGALNNKYQLFDLYAYEDTDNLYVHDLNNPVQLDGYKDDWLSYLDWSDSYQSEDKNKTDYFRLIASSDGNYFYAFIQVKDNELVYSSPNNEDEIDGDNLVLVYTDSNYILQRDYLAPTGPGLVRPFRFERRFDEYGVESDVRKEVTYISAVWQKTNTGYNIEIKIPEYVIGQRLGFVLNDTDNKNRNKEFNVIGTAGNKTFLQPNKLLRSSREIKNIIYTQGRSEGRRVWVLDSTGQVLASDGSLKRVFPENAFNIIYTLLLPPAYDQFKDDLAGASRLQGSEVKKALSGNTQTRWRSSPDGKAVIISAATPIWLDNKVVGAVVVEETTNNIQIMQRQVLANLFNKTLLIFIVIVFLLLWFAGRLSSRLINLNREASNAIDEYGKVKGKFSPSLASDEIGELSRSFSSILERLQQYHTYLEGMAGRLSHELKTPMAIVKSSLDRLQTEEDEKSRAEAIAAADMGLQRLQTLLTRLSEAARLEQALQEADKEEVNLNEFLKECINGYRLAYPGQNFNLNLADDVIYYQINRDLFYQMLDKFISNAVDFSFPGKVITIDLINQIDGIDIRVINYGSVLPEGMADELFNSMVSIRKARSEAGPHLGLGLFVARLIADFHNAKLSAINLTNEEGVCVSIKLK